MMSATSEGVGSLSTYASRSGSAKWGTRSPVSRSMTTVGLGGSRLADGQGSTQSSPPSALQPAGTGVGGATFASSPHAGMKMRRRRPAKETNEARRLLMRRSLDRPPPSTLAFLHPVGSVVVGVGARL